MTSNIGSSIIQGLDDKERIRNEINNLLSSKKRRLNGNYFNNNLEGGMVTESKGVDILIVRPTDGCNPLYLTVFLTAPPGIASFTEAIMTSPIRAYLFPVLPTTWMHMISRAPLLSTTLSLVYDWIIAPLSPGSGPLSLRLGPLPP